MLGNMEIRDIYCIFATYLEDVLIKIIIKSLLNTSITKELNWLRMRIKKVDVMLKKVGI